MQKFANRANRRTKIGDWMATLYFLTELSMIKFVRTRNIIYLVKPSNLINEDFSFLNKRSNAQLNF